MGGFKSGAADDDWGDATTDTGDDSAQKPDVNPSDTDATDSQATDKPNSDIQLDSESSPQQPSRQDLPWVLTRNSITDGREQTVQLHLQSSTLDSQRDTARSLESELGESIKKADLREAALLVGLRHSDEIASVLRTWGYDI